MLVKGQGNAFFGLLLIALTVHFFPNLADASSEVCLLVEKVEKVGHHEVRFVVKIENISSRAIFFTGIKDERGERLYPVYLEQWREKEGWVPITCIDTPPPNVIKLDPGETYSWAPSGWRLPMQGVCKHRITVWEGRFRFRVNYFDSEQDARAYVSTFFSPRWRQARAHVAVSEPFEIPPEPAARAR